MSWSKSEPSTAPIFDTQPLPNNPPPSWNEPTPKPFQIDTNIPLPVEPNPEPLFVGTEQIPPRDSYGDRSVPWSDPWSDKATRDSYGDRSVPWSDPWSDKATRDSYGDVPWSDPWSDKATTEELAAQWNHASIEQKRWREAELKLRSLIVEKSFSESLTGTHYAPLPEGWRIKCVKGLDYKLDPDKTDAALNNFDDSLAALLVKWEPKLSVSNYKVLNQESKAFFNDALTIKPGLPTIELVPPATPKG
jgi:hypothetical protein